MSPPAASEPAAAIQNGYVNGAGSERIALPVVAVKVRVPNTERVVQTHALLDGGSTGTLIAQPLMKKLGVKGEPCRVSLTTLETSNSTSYSSTCAITVSDIYDTHQIDIPTAFARSSLRIKEENIATINDINAWPHLRGIKIPTVSTSQVELIIGQDSPESLTPQTVIPGLKGEPYAIRTHLGWAISGPLKEYNSDD